jgi:PAS domain S-box-containing protein
MMGFLTGTVSQEPHSLAERRMRAYLDAALDCVILADLGGRIVEFNAAAERVFGYTRDEALGQPLAELIIPPSLRQQHLDAFTRFAETGHGHLFGRRLEMIGMRSNGSEFPVELALSKVEGEPPLVCGAVRDLSDMKRAEVDLLRLADQQAALRRVATLVAHEEEPPDLLAAVAKEAATVLKVPLVSIVRYEPDETGTVTATLDEQLFPIGSNWPLDCPSLMAAIRTTGRPARVDDYGELRGTVAGRIHAAGIHSAVGVPVVVDRKTWGAMIAVAPDLDPLPSYTETRLAEFTELVSAAIANAQAHAEVRGLADEQAALRRVAVLVAHGTEANVVFDAVCVETGRLMDATSVNLAHFTPDGFNLTMAGWSAHDTHVPTGTRLPLSADTINGLIQRTAAPARVDSYEGASGELARVIRQRGIRSEVGAPVSVEGHVWGALIAGTDAAQPLPPGAESRLARFAELIATAVSNASARSELVASRARIVTAGDAARRRVERNLHDGAQQRLVTLGLELDAVRRSVPSGMNEIWRELGRIAQGIEAALEDVREVSRGLHPALLSQSGLGASVRALARRSPVPVTVEVDLEQRPPESIEIAVYYVVSEALTNVAKHAQAHECSVSVRSAPALLRATIRDDGTGGAEASSGSGLIGLIDRVEALGGRFALDSPRGHGTTVAVELPFGVTQAEDPQQTQRSAGDWRFRLQTRLADVADPSTLLAAVMNVADALYVLDAQGRIRFLNPAALRILGYENEQQLLGRSSHETIHYMHPDGTPFPAAECPLLRPRVTGEVVQVDEDWFIRQDGRFVRVAYSSAAIPLSDGRGAVVSFRDLPPKDD